MEKLKFGKQSGHWLCIYMFCRVFPLKKSRNDFYKCRLTYKTNDGENSVEWSIPAKYLEENGCFTVSNDLYFARFRVSQKWEIEKDEDGNMIKDENGEPKVRQILCLGKMIDFWNTRVFGSPSENYLHGSED